MSAIGNPELDAQVPRSREQNAQGIVDREKHRRIGRPSWPERRGPDRHKPMIDTQTIEEQIDARFRVKNPSPGDSGHNEGERIRKKKDISEYCKTDQPAIE